MTESGTLSSGLLDNTAGRITWHAWRETTGTSPAVIRLWDGTGTGGKLLVPVSLLAGQSTRDYTGEHAMPYQTGLYLEVVSGTVEGQVLALAEGEWLGGAPVFIVGELDVNVVTSGA